MKKRVVMYSSNSKRRAKDSNCIVLPRWAKLWDQLAEDYSDCEIYLVVQLNGRYYLDIRDGELVDPPTKIHLEIMDLAAGIDEFVENSPPSARMWRLPCREVRPVSTGTV